MEQESVQNGQERIADSTSTVQSERRRRKQYSYGKAVSQFLTKPAQTASSRITDQLHESTQHFFPDMLISDNRRPPTYPHQHIYNSNPSTSQTEFQNNYNTTTNITTTTNTDQNAQHSLSLLQQSQDENTSSENTYKFDKRDRMRFTMLDRRGGGCEQSLVTSSIPNSLQNAPNSTETREQTALKNQLKSIVCGTKKPPQQPIKQSTSTPSISPLIQLLSSHQTTTTAAPRPTIPQINLPLPRISNKHLQSDQNTTTTAATSDLPTNKTLVVSLSTQSQTPPKNRQANSQMLLNSHQRILNTEETQSSTINNALLLEESQQQLHAKPHQNSLKRITNRLLNTSTALLTSSIQRSHKQHLLSTSSTSQQSTARGQVAAPNTTIGQTNNSFESIIEQANGTIIPAITKTISMTTAAGITSLMKNPTTTTNSTLALTAFTPKPMEQSKSKQLTFIDSNSQTILNTTQQHQQREYIQRSNQRNTADRNLTSNSIEMRKCETDRSNAIPREKSESGLSAKQSSNSSIRIQNQQNQQRRMPGAITRQNSLHVSQKESQGSRARVTSLDLLQQPSQTLEGSCVSQGINGGRSASLQDKSISVSGNLVASARRTSIRSSFSSSQDDVLRTLKRMSIGKVEIAQLLSQQSEDSKRLMQEFSSQWPAIIGSIMRRDLEAVQTRIVYLLNVLVRLNDMQGFLRVLMLLVKVAIEFSDFNRAVFFLIQAKLVCDYTSSLKRKLECLRLLAAVATTTKKYTQAIPILNKALQYAWHVKDINSELEIYDQLGLNYFYLGEIEIAKVYHERFMNGSSESESSLFRSSASSDITYFYKKLDMRSTGFSRCLFQQLNLPIINIFEQADQLSNNNNYNQQYQQTNNSSRGHNTITSSIVKRGGFSDIVQQQQQQQIPTTTVTCDANKYISYKNCDHAKLIEQLLQSEEFEYQLPPPQVSTMLHQRSVVPSTTPEQSSNDASDKLNQKHQLEQQQSKLRFVNRLNIQGNPRGRSKSQKSNSRDERNFSDSSKYKVSIETKVKTILQDKSSYESSIAKVNRMVSMRSCVQDLPPASFLSQFEKDRIRQIEEHQLLPQTLKTKYSALLADIIAELLIRKHAPAAEHTDPTGISASNSIIFN